MHGARVGNCGVDAVFVVRMASIGRETKQEHDIIIATHVQIHTVANVRR